MQLHKQLQGLLDAYKYIGNQRALQMVIRCLDGFVQPFVKSIYAQGGVDLMQYALEIEFGGMQDVIYQIYSITQNEEHKWYASKSALLKTSKKLAVSNYSLVKRNRVLK